MGGGNQEIKIMEEIAIKEATQKGYAKASAYDSVNLAYPNSNTRRGRMGKGVAQTIMTSGEEQGVIVYDDYNGRIKSDQSTINTLTRNCGNDAERNGVKIIEPTIWGSLQEHCAVKKDGICPTLPGAMGMGGGQIPVHNYGYRIRKLTPKETWRLMGFDDEDVEKAKTEGISNSQLYKQAGNSIVVNVLMAIFKKMI